MSYQYCITVLHKNIATNGDSEQIEQSIKRAIDVISIERFSNNQQSAHNITFKLISSKEFDGLQNDLQQLSNELSFDIILKPWQQSQVTAKLLIMDMDSTLVQAETIDEIARIAGVGEKVAAITESAMRGELDFTESLLARVGMLKGIAVDELDAVHDSLPLTGGAKVLLDNAHKQGCHTALVSGGFTLFARPLVEQLGIDTLSANQLEIVDNQLTGKVIGKIVDGESKLKTLRALQQQLGIDEQQIIAIGDGANDLPMLRAAGTGIAFHAKPKVQQQASSIINHNDLEAVSWFLNWS